MLYRFTGGSDGALPQNGLAADAKGNLYGTASTGGLDVCSSGTGLFGCGVVFRLSTGGKEKVLYDFTGVTEGFTPQSGLVRDTVGNLYGTTSGGGGDVFEISSAGTQTVLHSFFGINDDGHFPIGTLIRDASGNLYGTTLDGGAFDHGIVFKVDTGGNEIILWNFTGGLDGSNPYGAVVLDAEGNLYGTATEGGAFSHGTVFKLTP